MMISLRNPENKHYNADNTQAHSANVTYYYESTFLMALMNRSFLTSL